MPAEEHMPTRFQRAEVLLDDGHIDQALAAFHSVIAEGGDDMTMTTALFGVATCYARRKQWEEAEEVLNQVIHQSPTFAAAYAYRGAIRLDLGRVDDSFTDLEHAVTIDPTSAISFLKQAEVYLRLGLLPLAHTAVHTAAKMTAPDIATRDYIRAFARTIDKEMQTSLPRNISPMGLGWLHKLPWFRRLTTAPASTAETGVVS